MTAARAVGSSMAETKVIFRLEGFGKVTLINGHVDLPDLVRECRAILKGYRSQLDGHPDTYAALTLIDRYGGRILEVEDAGLNVRIS